ncbi:MAG TPA: BamA/TamA family outer membrane protein [Bacteroidales bacterium]|nr:BamA/TamA family outer membrane protein [Bacteroidales bacterium]
MRRILIILNAIIVLNISEAPAQFSYFVVREFNVTGNTKTELSVIMRESTLNVNDTLTLLQINKLLEEFRDNLIKTSLFNFVNIDHTFDSVYVDIQVKVEERWYFWPYPILEHAERNLSTFIHNHDFNKINYGVAADIYNINGTNAMVKLKARFGYKEHFLLAFHKIGLGQKKNSSVKIQVELFRQKATEYDVANNIPLYVSNEDVYISHCFLSGINYSYRPELNYVFNFGMKYKYSVYKDSLFFADFLNSGNELRTSYFNPYFNFSFDSRNNKLYPVKGVLMDLYYGENRSLSSETGSYTTLGINVQYNKQIIKSVFSIRSELSYFYLKDYGQKPVLFKDILEFSRNFWIRGYELYYLIGQQSFGYQNTIGVKISDFKIHRLASFLPDKISKTYSRIYFDFFFDICYVQSWNDEFAKLNPMNDKLLFSTGMAINLETYYDRLLSIYVAYLGYSSKTGIFVNYKTPLYKLF